MILQDCWGFYFQSKWFDQTARRFPTNDVREFSQELQEFFFQFFNFTILYCKNIFNIKTLNIKKTYLT